MNNHILVVGAGIVGLTAAYALVKRGHQVTLVDNDEHPGGLLRSIPSEFGHFDYGTHVACHTGEPSLDAFLFDDLGIEMHTFDVGHSSSFYQKMSSVSPFLNINNASSLQHSDYAGSLLAVTDQDEPANLKEKYQQHYGSVIYEKVLSGVVKKYFGADASVLSAGCFPFFDLNRIIAFDAPTSSYLKQLPLYNDKLGFHGASRGAMKCYPKSGGIGAWYQALLHKAIDAGVSFIPGCSIKDVETKENRFCSVDTSHGRFNIDALFWAVPSPILSRYVAVSQSVSKPEYRPTALYHFAFDKPLHSESYYINVPDPDMIAGRLTLYQNLCPDSTDSFKVTVEALNGADFDFSAATSKVLDELLKMGLIDEHHRCLYQTCQPIKQGFPVITAQTQQQMALFNDAILKDYANLSLLGRGNCKGFFMADLLQKAYQSANEVRGL
ncbi:FAD-dependent oxidoreductase [Motilimonas sp. KMU-193]|uniref:FAD-dependent oxidoreductase n=1 Tax=Motilimonas sp. KMU-193 TaxID=3388668 RepID=UPI00396B270F